MADRPRDLAERMARRRKMGGKPGERGGDGFLRETLHPAARGGAGEGGGFLRPLPQGRLYERGRDWRELPGGEIEFTMRRLPSAD